MFGDNWGVDEVLIWRNDKAQFKIILSLILISIEIHSEISY